MLYFFTFVEFTIFTLSFIFFADIQLRIYLQYKLYYEQNINENILTCNINKL